MNRKKLTTLMFCTLLVANISYIKAQGDAFFYEQKNESRTSMSVPLKFSDFNSEDNLKFDDFDLTNETPLGNPLLLMMGLALAYKTLRRKKD